MKWIKKNIIVLLLFAWATGAYETKAQSLIEVRIDSAAILIGEQTKLHLTVTTPKTHPVSGGFWRYIGDFLYRL